MYVASQRILTRLIGAAPAAMLRAGCVALFVCVSGCGGGSDGAPPPSPVPTTAPTPAPGTTQPLPATEPLIVGTAQSIDSGARGNPFSLRVARSANGDGFAVWMANEGERNGLWVNRYRAAAAAWGSPINIETSSATVTDLALAVDPSGNAVVAWTEEPTDPHPTVFGSVMSARFDAGTGVWTTPVLLSAHSSLVPHVATDASGAVLVVYMVLQPRGNGFLGPVVRGRFFDPVSGTWQPEAAIGQEPPVGQSRDPVPLLDGSGNALVAFSNLDTFDRQTAMGSNYYSRSGGGWGLGVVVPGGSGGAGGGLDGDFQLAASTDGNFLLAWNSAKFDGTCSAGADIRIAQFTSRTQTWSAAQTVVSGDEQQRVQLWRMGSDAAGNAHLLWTENDDMRTAALKALRLDHAGAVSEAAQVIDSAVGWAAGLADLAVDPLGQAIAIWRQFPGGSPNPGFARSNIAISRFDGATGTWTSAVLAETQPGNAISPRASAGGGQALLGWIQAEGGVNRVKALLQPLTDTPSQ